MGVAADAPVAPATAPDAPPGPGGAGDHHEPAPIVAAAAAGAVAGATIPLMRTPGAPARTVQPTQPGRPSSTVQPAQPVQPSQPIRPAPPVQPARPTPPAGLAQPVAPGAASRADTTAVMGAAGVAAGTAAGAAHAASAGPGPVAPAAPGPATGPVAPGAVAPGAVQPEAVKPAAVKSRPAARKPQTATRTVNPGDKVCGQCGEGNDPSRRFCRRCGASLTEAAIFALPWYRRAWLRMNRRKQHTAGERPRQRRRAVGGAGPGWLTSWVTRLIALAAIVLVVLFFVGPWKHPIRTRVGHWYHSVANAIHPAYRPVDLTSAVATSSARGHPPINAIDGLSNTSWQSNRKETNQVLLIHLHGPIDVDKVGFLMGDTDSPQSYDQQPRPEQVRMIFTGTAQPYSKTITAADSASFQTFTVKAKHAEVLAIYIQSVYPSNGAGRNVSITEVELFSLKR